jgi:hypothetical protein
MIAHGPKSLCKEAELYYYDFLCDESRRLIPEPVVSHIEQCLHCREQINHLEVVLSQADSLKSERGRVSSAVTTMLKLHFAYIGKPVTCNIVKPFLPTLLDRALGMRIPTPIVTHVCDCQQCSEDLDIIRCLNLSREQLCRLSQLFADKPVGSNISCTEAQNAIPSVVPMVFSETDLEVLKHLCTCPICRKLVYKERQKLCDGLPEYTSSSEFPCESASASDFFDYVVPYGIDPANDQYAKFRESFTSHVTNCPKCLAKMQQLHQTIYGIAERVESDVVTIYHVDESAKAETPSEPDDIYAGFPIRVETINREDRVNAGGATSTIDFGAVLKHKVLAMNMKPLVKTAAAVAAVILIAVVLFQNIPTAKAVTLERIYEAIEKIRNVHIASFVPGRTKPTQERWISRTANTYMLKTEKESVLWDITKGVRKSKQLNAAITETVPLTTVSVADAETKITGSLGLMPFYDISDVPEGADWSRVADKDLEAAAKGVEVYDLTWTERAYDGSTVSKKWRFFVNAKADLPQKIEIYQILPTDTEYILKSLMAIEYLSESEIQEVIKEASF